MGIFTGDLALHLLERMHVSDDREIPLDESLIVVVSLYSARSIFSPQVSASPHLAYNRVEQTRARLLDGWAYLRFAAHFLLTGEMDGEVGRRISREVVACVSSCPPVDLAFAVQKDR